MKGHVNLAWASDHLQLFKLTRLFIFVLFLRNRLCNAQNDGGNKSGAGTVAERNESKGKGNKSTKSQREDGKRSKESGRG